ncbi:MAG: FYDLN acid domain-containing protein [Alphaproteobacteria bacterium]|nr:FYDLN acid domain-containing protein [Alphaproteobacteria bacterium]
MDKTKWGIKRKCPKCGAFFYDMGKAKFKCPKCDVEYTEKSYQEAKTKQLAKMAKKATPKLDDADLDADTLLKLAGNIPLGDDDASEPADLLEESEELENADPDFNDLMDNFEDDKNA